MSLGEKEDTFAAGKEQCCLRRLVKNDDASGERGSIISSETFDGFLPVCAGGTENSL